MHALLRLTTLVGLALLTRAIVREARAAGTTRRLPPPKHERRAAASLKRTKAAR